MDVFRYAPVGVLLLAMTGAVLTAVLLATPALRRGDRQRAVTLAARTLLAGACLAVVALTFGHGVSTGPSINLLPGAGIRGQMDNVNPRIGVANVVGNVALFVPLGLLTPLALRWPFGRTVAVAALASVALELIQLLLGRAADIDDVILRTLGAMVGAAVAVSLVKAMAARPSHAERDT